MHISKLDIPEKVVKVLESRGFTELRPAQWKAVNAGLFEDKNLLVCTPTASGKTLVGELGALNAVFHDRGKAVYIVPLRALASEKYNQFKKDYPNLKIALASGDIDGHDTWLERYDIIIVTSEKFDSLIRHKAAWLTDVKVLIVDEIHLLNDVSRGPTLEVILTIMKNTMPKTQIIGLSATIGNPEVLAKWLNAELILDNWRPVELKKGIYLDGDVDFY
jgi:helicase